MRASMKPELVPFRSVNMPLIDSETHAEENDAFLMDMLDYSLDASRIWRDKFAIRESNMENGQSLVGRRPMVSLSANLRAIHRIMRWCAYFPRFPKNGKTMTSKRRLIRVLLYTLSILMIMLNLFLLKHTVSLSLIFKRKFGLLHASTVSSLITGIKPFINFVLITLFLVQSRAHLHMVKCMDNVDALFKAAFNKSARTDLYTVIFIFFCFIALAVPFSLNMMEYVVTNSRLLDNIMKDLSLLIVPLLTLWNVLPLMYYELCNRIVRFWCRTMTTSLKRESCRRHFQLRFYYEQFLRITSVQEAIGKLFNPFILFSLAWSLLLLCLTIYFVTQPTSSLLEPLTEKQISSELHRQRLTRAIHFTLGWASLQIFVALAYIFTICATGMRTNEETRQIVSAVLAIVPEHSTEADRFQINCFVHKMSTQYMWGMTVWRAFPLERSTFFTILALLANRSLMGIRGH
uniref:G_PROTEIN_RECEP_F1_2 domain-containing protein n=1 Tax=Steinernema glaseri TaxID=37863 RepID=A0A1I7YDF0_9BILA